MGGMFFQELVVGFPSIELRLFASFTPFLLPTSKDFNEAIFQ